ncbi:MAG: dihydrolipoyl dehydrogenase [Rhodocyclaceae bacterium]
MGSTNRQVEVAIIGAGTAGLAALRAVRRATDDFLLINDGAFGTTCARVGCMPSKALIEVANAFHRRGFLARTGISGTEALGVDTAAVLRHVRSLRDHYVSGVLALTEKLGDRVMAGRARFVDRETLEVAGQTIRAQRIIVATGSRPAVPKAWLAFGDRILTSDTLFEQESLPRRIAVIGLGAIGLEMAQALARLGVEVTGFDALPHVGGLTDPHLAAQAKGLFAEEFAMHLGQPAELAAAGDAIRITAGDESATVDVVLGALGRRPNLDGLGLDSLGLELDAHGKPEIDPHTMQVAGTPIFVAGDVSGLRALQHEAADDGYIAGGNAVGAQIECFKRRVPLAIVFSDPNLAAVGQRFAELAPGESVVGEADLKGQGRLRMAAADHGLIRLYAGARSGRLLGAELCAPAGEHLAHLLALAIQQDLTVNDMLRMPFYHPVVEEGLRSALRDAASRLPGSGGSDLANCSQAGADALD